MGSRKAFYLALIALDWIFWLASLFVYFVNVEVSGYFSGIILTVEIILIPFGLVLEFFIFSFWTEIAKIHIGLAYQTGFVCISAILLIIEICAFGSMKYEVSRLIKFISQLCIILYNDCRQALRPTQVPQLSQPRPNLLANQRPTAMTPNFEDVEQPPPSYEEYLARRNDMPPKYEDLEEAPPAYQETMV